MLASQKTTGFLVVSIITVVVTGIALGSVCMYCNNNSDPTCSSLLPVILACCHMAAQGFFLCMIVLYTRQGRIKKREENWTKDLNL